jgi:hypothetical protein
MRSSPLAVPLAVLVFLASFIPLVDGAISLTVAALVAFAARGPWIGLAVVILVPVIGQIEGHVLQPLIMGHRVSLHPGGRGPHRRVRQPARWPARRRARGTDRRRRLVGAARDTSIGLGPAADGQQRGAARPAIASPHGRPCSAGAGVGQRRIRRTERAAAQLLRLRPLNSCRKNSNTFSASRKMDAAINGAESVSEVRRSRWKSNMVTPAKMTKPRME